LSKKWISLILWILSFIIMLLVLFYQRTTGPTNPIKGTETFDSTYIKYRFIRSSISQKPLPVKITADGPIEDAILMSRIYKSGEKWSEKRMIKTGNLYSSEITGMPSAGKVEYAVSVIINGKKYLLNNGKAAVARFRGDVPGIIVIPHILLMFLAILFGTRTGMEAARKDGNYGWMVAATLIIVILGGLVFGPLMQKYAFGKFWTGFPFGYDLTDNKMLLSIFFWVAAFFLRKKSKYWVIAAAILMIAVYLIPHSVLGSELDPKTGLLKTKL
jgi:hypothetical protein